jgi:uncharacterized membrane protein YdjX (TVP38/TMEM64 family)
VEKVRGNGKMNRIFKTALFLIPVIMVCFFVDPVYATMKQAFYLLGTCDVESIKSYILSYGIWAPVVSFFLMIFQSVIAPLPAFLITFSNAALFGWIKGAVLSWTSAMAGAAVCFYISRFFGRKTVAKLTSQPAIENVDVFFKKYGNYAVLTARLLPFVSFDIVSYAAGLTSMNFWSFFWATGVGQLPATLIYSYSGEMLVGGTKKFVFGLLTIFALGALVAMMKKILAFREMSS